MEVGRSTSRGRPRGFDKDEALDQALDVFWRKGYEGATLPDLTAAMGINRPSLYAAFGNKEALFRKVVERYTTGPAAHRAKALAAPTLREVVEQLFQGTIHMACNAASPGGCMVLNATLSCSDAAEPIRRELLARRIAEEKALTRRFERALAEGELHPDADPHALAVYVLTVLYGMAVQSAGGAKRKTLQRIAELTMKSLPWK